MIVKLKYTPMALILISLNGCASIVDKSMSPPSDTHWVNVEIKNPSPYTAPFPLEVVYISHKCLKEYISGFDGKKEKEPSYNPITIPLERQGNSNIWHAKVAMNGGGSCQWTLSEFNLGIEYIDAIHLGKDLVPGTAVGATIAFDDVASRNGQFKNSYGDLTLNSKYYPFIIEWNIIKDKKELNLFGENKFSSYRVHNVKSILFNPILDEGKIVRYIEPKAKGGGMTSKMLYPDCTINTDEVRPDFKRVEKAQISNQICNK